MNHEVWLALAIDIAQRLEKGRLQAAREPQPGILVLEWRVPGETLRQVLAVDQGGPTTYFTGKRWPNAPTPPRFLSRLRKIGVGLRLLEVEWSDDTLLFLLGAPGGGETLRLEWSPDTDTGIRLFRGETPLEVIRPLFTRGAPRTIPWTGESCPTGDALHKALEDLHFESSETSGFESQRQEMRKRIRKQVKKAQRLARNVANDLQKAEQGHEKLQLGEWLKPIASSLPAGLTETKVTDYSSPTLASVTVPLDPRLNGLANMKRYFHAGSRLKAAEIRIRRRLESVQAEVELLLKAADAVEKAEHIEELEKIQSHLPRKRGHTQSPPESRKTSKGETQRSPYKEYRSRKGARILVGRSARDNDRLTFTVGRGNDIWLHARGRRGAHVLIPGNDRSGPSEGCIADAARLCAFHSEGGKADTHIEVWVVPRKHVRKPKGAPAGSVTYSGGRSVWVRGDDPITSELLDSLLRE